MIPLEILILMAFPLDPGTGNNLLHLAQIIIGVIVPLKVQVDDPLNPMTAALADQLARADFLSEGGALIQRFSSDMMRKLPDYAQAVSETVFLGVPLGTSFTKYEVGFGDPFIPDPSGKMTIHAGITIGEIG